MAASLANLSMSQVADSVDNAAASVSVVLTSLGKPHAIIGGQAVRMLGSSRTTVDVDILVAEPAAPLRDLIVEKDSRLSIYNGIKLVFNSENNYLVPVELLYGGPGIPLALPNAQTASKLQKSGAYILHPATLIITKVKRWTQYAGSTRPQSMAKARSDLMDLEFLIGWLFEESMKVNFAEYEAVKPKTELLPHFKVLYGCMNPSQRAKLQGILDQAEFEYVSS